MSAPARPPLRVTYVEGHTNAREAEYTVGMTSRGNAPALGVDYLPQEAQTALQEWLGGASELQFHRQAVDLLTKVSASILPSDLLERLYAWLEPTLTPGRDTVNWPVAGTQPLRNATLREALGQAMNTPGAALPEDVVQLVRDWLKDAPTPNPHPLDRPDHRTEVEQAIDTLRAAAPFAALRQDLRRKLADYVDAIGVDDRCMGEATTAELATALLSRLQDGMNTTAVRASLRLALQEFLR